MADSKIVKALKQFKVNYAWDKSLSVSAANASTRRPDLSATALAASLADTSVEDFVRASQARAQQDRI